MLLRVLIAQIDDLLQLMGIKDRVQGEAPGAHIYQDYEVQKRL